MWQLRGLNGFLSDGAGGQERLTSLNTFGGQNGEDGKAGSMKTNAEAMNGDHTLNRSLIKLLLNFYYFSAALFGNLPTSVRGSSLKSKMISYLAGIRRLGEQPCAYIVILACRVSQWLRTLRENTSILPQEECVAV
jgi:hypothetical protein